MCILLYTGMSYGLDWVVRQAIGLPSTPFVKVVVRWVFGRRSTNYLPDLSLTRYLVYPLVCTWHTSQIPIYSSRSSNVWKIPTCRCQLGEIVRDLFTQIHSQETYLTITGDHSK